MNERNHTSCQIACCRQRAAVTVRVPFTRFAVRYCATCWENYAADYIVGSTIPLTIHFS